jgi:hypothetical protein
VNSARVVVYESRMTGERFELPVPLTSTIEPDELRRDLGLPDYLDTAEPNVARAIGIIWAAAHIEEVSGHHQALRRLQRPARLAAFGGVAFRFLCPAANSGPLSRPLHDADLVTAKQDGSALLELLSALETILGTRYWHAVTKGDATFNSMRAGRRYRVHGVKEDPDVPDGIRHTVLDILADEIEFCHTVPVDFESTARDLHTIGAARLVLTKLQYIRRLRSSDVDETLRHRVIASSGSDELIGPEDKDLTDVAALLHDRGVGSAPGQIDPDELHDLLRRDWRLAKTVGLNTANTAGFEHALRSRGATADTAQRVLRSLTDVRAVVETAAAAARQPRLKLRSDWWQVVEDA